MISAVVLAAGTASRFGSTKQLVEIDGKPLVQHAIDAAAAAELDEIVVVLGHDADRVREAIELPSNGRAIVNEGYAEGQSTSLAAGLRALDTASEAAVVLLGDQPGVRPEEILALAQRFAETRASILRLRYRNGPGPALLGRDIWPEAFKLRGDIGGRGLFGSHEVEELEIVRDAPRDIDSPVDMNSSRPD